MTLVALADHLVQILLLVLRQRLEPEVIQLLRCRSNWTYPDPAIIPMESAALTARRELAAAEIGIIPPHSWIL